MAKKIIHRFVFDASAKTVTINEIIAQKRLLTITNVTRNEIIYAFPDTVRGASSYVVDTVAKTTTITLDFDTTSHADTDELQIFIEKDSTEMRPDKTYTDPVSKFRVSQPENLIDTDFEYGLQTTKWETLELIRNIPTFFSRNGDQDIAIEEMTSVKDSNQVRVSTTDEHNLVQGNPIIVIGSRSNTANGGFVVTKIIDANTFVYTAKANLITTGSIKDTYTQIFLASIYQGTEFKLNNINGITTDNASPSKLTVSTEYPLGLNEGTSFFLVNSVGQKVVPFTAGAGNVVHENFKNIGNSTQVNVFTNEVPVDGQRWTVGAVDQARWIPKYSPSDGLNVKWFISTTDATKRTVELNTAGGVETFTFSTPHGFNDGDYVVYLHGCQNGAIGGLTDTRPYYVRKVDDNTFWLTLYGPSDNRHNTNRVNITGHGGWGQVAKSCFVTAFNPRLINRASSQESVVFDSVIPLVANDPNQAFICFYSYVGINSTSYYVNNSESLQDYTQNNNQILFPRSVQVINNETVMQFARTPNGGALNMSRTSHGGAVVLMDPNPYADTLYFQNHGLTTGDVVRFESSSSSVPSGLTRNDYYNVEVIDQHRIKLSDYRSNSQNNLRGDGAVSATISIAGWSAVDGADFIDATQTITPPATTVSYSVTVATGTGGGNKFYIDGTEAPALVLTEGNTYEFMQDDVSNTTHPLRFYTAADKSGGEYTTGVTTSGTPGTDGITTIVVPVGGPDLFYQCSAHAAMGAAATTPAPTAISQGHGLTDGDAVVYTDEGNTTIAGLTNSQTYYVVNATEFKLQLATTVSGYEGSNFTFRHSTGGSRNTGYIYNYDYIWKNGHGLIDGDRVQYTSSTPVNGLRNGAFYYVDRIDNNRFRLNRTLAGALAATGWPDRIRFAIPYSGTGRIRKTTIVDFTGAGAGAQKLTASIDGASDSVYTLNTKVDDRTFQMNAQSQIPPRSIPFNPDSAVWIEQDAIRIPDHFLRTGFSVVFNEGTTAPGGLTDGTTYYIIRQSQNWIKLAATELDAIDGTAITLTSKGVGQCTLNTPNIIGEVLGQGTATLDLDKTTIEGSGTNFTSFFKTGDDVTLYKPETFVERNISSMSTSNNRFTTSVNHGYTTEDIVIFTASSAPTGLTSGFIYYVRVHDANEVYLHLTAADAAASANTIGLSGTITGGKLQKITSAGDTVVQRVLSVLSPNKMEVEEAGADPDLTDVNYSVASSLILRADGFALHRPYDGGVELIPSTNPDSQMIRQTRKYFRYQSGKGIQVSFAVNFSPTTQIERIEYGGTGTQARVYTKFPHRLSVGLNITIKDVNLVNGVNYFNGVFPVSTIYDDYSFHITLPNSPSSIVNTGGYGFYHVNAWTNSELRCGLFDDQNGMFFEFDGQILKCCRRKSIKQIAGTCTVTFGTGIVQGLNTKFLSQCNVDEYIVLKGQSYQIAQIDSDTVMYITPSYRGKTQDGVVGTITETIKVNQSNWNIDTADGLGPTGYVLDLNTIQMAYIDYSWYGAGKIRFGFKDQDGDVQYVHQFVHNNLETEAYMRSGNMPARYDIQNKGTPTYVPALAHWGTSVIMDGRFDDDKAYVFTASSNDVAVTGSASVTVTGKVEYTGDYSSLIDNRLRRIGRCIVINTNSNYNQLSSGMAISGANLQSGTRLRNPSDSRVQPYSPYLPEILASEGFSYSGQATRNLLVIDRTPTGTANSNSSYTVTLSNASTPVVYDIPLISIRLAPSVDTGTIGRLGEREIINRMQLLLNSVGILTTHTIEVVLRLNGSIDNANWQAVESPSLSQLIYHGTGDSIEGGVNLFKFRAAGTSGSSNRTQAVTEQKLGEVASLGNSIMGGDNIFPDGPDILTVVARLTEDPGTVSNSNPLLINSRISWSESQA